MLKLRICRVIDVTSIGTETIIVLQVQDDSFMRGKVILTSPQGFGFPVDRGAEKTLTMVPVVELLDEERVNLKWNYSQVEKGQVVLARIAEVEGQLWVVRWTPDFVWAMQSWRIKGLKARHSSSPILKPQHTR